MVHSDISSLGFESGFLKQVPPRVQLHGRLLFYTVSIIHEWLSRLTWSMQNLFFHSFDYYTAKEPFQPAHKYSCPTLPRVL